MMVAAIFIITALGLIMGAMLGIANLRIGNKEEALKAFQTVTKNPIMVRIAKLWVLSTERGTG